MLFSLDKIKRVMHLCSLQLEITMLRVALSYLLPVISIMADEHVKTVIKHNSHTYPPEHVRGCTRCLLLICLHASLSGSCALLPFLFHTYTAAFQNSYVHSAYILS